MIRIKSIKFYNHIIFKNQLYDFTLDGINTANNIIIAGENGCGKTKFLEEIYDISNKTFYTSQPTYSQKLNEIVLDLSDENYCNYESEDDIINEAILISTRNDNGNISNTIQFKNKNKVNIRKVKKIGANDQVSSLKINSIYSSVNVNYKSTMIVQGATNKTLDNQISSIPDDMAYEIIQLLVDITMQDSCDLDRWVTEHRLEAIPENIYHARTKRFTKAFKTIFEDSIIYKGIINNSIPIFKKNNNDIQISSLSSGEKQIIFRGVHLLQNKNSLKGVPVLIDEPEISMHPKWEERIFDYYKNMFLEGNEQTSQLFVATHSEHILSNVLNKKDCLVIKIKNNSYEKFYKDSSGSILPTITIAEIKYSIFDLYTTDFHSLLYGYIQQNYVKDRNGNTITNANVKEMDEWLKNQGITLKHYCYQISPTKIKEYDTLPTYVRNCIDHPNSSITYNHFELKQSIEELINIISKNS